MRPNPVSARVARSRSHLAAALVVTAIAVEAPRVGSTPGEGQPITSMSAEVRAELAPLGRLRVALNYGNVLLVSSRAPEQTGVAPDLARELARRAGTPVEFVGYPNAGLAADAARDNAWDVAFIGAAITLGALVGALVLKVGGVPLTLSTAGGALIAGLVFGWLRSVRPFFGRIPAPTVWFMNNGRLPNEASERGSHRHRSLLGDARGRGDDASGG